MDNKRKHCFIAWIIQMIFINTLQTMLKLDLMFHIMNYVDYCLKKKIKKVIGLVKDQLSRKVTKKFVGLRAKGYGYLLDDDVSENKKSTRHKKGAKT